MDSYDGTRVRVIECAAPGSSSVSPSAVSAGTGAATADGPSLQRGVPIILAHGFTSTADHWAPVAARLVERGFRVIAFDQRGHGGSTSPTGRFRPSDLGHDLAAVIEATAPTGAVLVGHSMGGIGIQAMLADHEALRDDLRGVVLVATLARPVEVPLGRLMGKLGGTPLARRVMGNRIHGRLMARGGVGAEPSITVIDVIRDGWATSSDATRAGVMRDLRDFDLSEALRVIHVPTTVIAGDRDLVTPFEENRRIAELLPNGRLEAQPGVGHAAHWEAADRVVAIAAAYASTGTDRPPDPSPTNEAAGQTGMHLDRP